MKKYNGFIHYGDKGAGYGFGHAELAETKKLMLEGITYYKELGYAIKDATIQATCDKCHNDGTYKIRKPRSIKTVQCKCKRAYMAERYEFVDLGSALMITKL